MYAGGLHTQCCNRAMRGANDTSYGHQDQDAAMFAAWKIDYLKSDPSGVQAKNIGKYNQKWIDAFTKIGYLDKLHFQGDSECGYKPRRPPSCENHTAAQANSWRTTGVFSYAVRVLPR